MKIGAKKFHTAEIVRNGEKAARKTNSFEFLSTPRHSRKDLSLLQWN